MFKLLIILMYGSGMDRIPGSGYGPVDNLAICHGSVRSGRKKIKNQVRSGYGEFCLLRSLRSYFPLGSAGRPVKCPARPLTGPGRPGPARARPGNFRARITGRPARPIFFLPGRAFRGPSRNIPDMIAEALRKQNIWISRSNFGLGFYPESRDFAWRTPSVERQFR